MKQQYMAKLDVLRELLRQTGGCAVAYSGGVDSSLLLAAAYEVLGDRVLAVTATSSTYSKREHQQALRWVEGQKIPHVTIVSEELDIPKFRENPPDRCYHCKKELFTKVREEAAAHGLDCVADGTNADDVTDYRPGMRAAEELGVISPLKEAGLDKDAIRALARDVYYLPMADKPAMACLASRFPYGSTITKAKLKQVEAVEQFLMRLGFSPCRARHHDQVLRIELACEHITDVFRTDTRDRLMELARGIGFTYVAIDLVGYRTGSMNEVLSPANEETGDRQYWADRQGRFAEVSHLSGNSIGKD